MSAHRCTRLTPRSLGTRRRVTALAAGLAVVAAGVLTVGSAQAGAIAGPGETKHRDYVALGDSYASGLGTGAYDPASGSCLRSPLAYPRLWAASHRATSFASRACANATAGSVGATQVWSSLNPGTDYVTVTVGGNDATAQSLSDAEREHARALLRCPPYADLSIGQLWVRELDEGRYPCSLSSLYRIARQAGMTRERRRQASHPARVVPELVADGPSQVWTWDITKLRGPVKGVWYHLHVLIDVYSRYNPGWLLAAAEDSVVAAEFIADAIDRNGHAPHTVHADRGTSMTS